MKTLLLLTVFLASATWALAAQATAAEQGAVAAHKMTVQPNKAGVYYVPGSEIEKAFAAPGELFNAGKYSVRTSARSKPGRPEVHTDADEVLYIVEGGATLVTGGKLTNEKKEGDEISGSGIEGGESQHLAKGDIVTLPKNVPHWMKQVDGSIQYLIVRIP